MPENPMPDLVLTARIPCPTRTALALHTRRALFGALILLLAAPLPLHAQIGSLVRKAATKATQQAVETSGVTAPPPAFDEVVLELDEQRLAKVIAGLEAARAVTGPDGATRAALLQRASAANTQRNALYDNRGAELERWDNESRRVNLCTSAVMDSINQVHRAAMEKKSRELAAMPDPMNSPIMREVMRVTADLNRLLAAGDTAGAVRMQRELARAYGMDPARDSAHATSRCGTPPAKPAWQLQADSLLTIANSLLRQAQAIDEQAAAAGARASGMNAQQFGMARERIEAYAAANGNPSSSWRYSVVERKALYPRLQQLKTLL